MDAREGSALGRPAEVVSKSTAAVCFGFVLRGAGRPAADGSRRASDASVLGRPKRAEPRSVAGRGGGGD